MVKPRCASCARGVTSKDIHVIRGHPERSEGSSYRSNRYPTLNTVTTHVRHIYEKLEVSSRGEAVFEAVQQGLIRLRE